MLLDTAVPFGQQYATSDQCRQAILAIQSHQADRGAATHWANHLRFLTAAVESQWSSPGAPSFDARSSQSGRGRSPEGLRRYATGDSEAEPECVCEDHNATRFKKNSRRLRRTKASELPHCIHYVAVSYCWQSTAGSGKLDKTILYNINTSGGMRHSKVNPEVLNRTIAFARPRKVNYIWIDQECINQDDRIDQRDGVQAMDLVYQQAQICLGLLNVCVAKQEHLDALNTMFEGESINEPQLHDLADALDLILSDPWFTRAWILQESLTGAAQMTLQMKCDPRLDKGAYLEPMYGSSSEYLEIELTQLHTYLSTWLPTTVEDMVADCLIEQPIASRLERIMEKWFGVLPPQVPLDHDSSRRLACNGAAAISYLNRRQNTVIADRIAIMANLCNYHKRLDSVELDLLGYNFSLCAVVLSIMNGDISILQGYVHPVRNLKRRVDDLEPQKYYEADKRIGFTWSLPEWATLDALKYRETELTDARIYLYPSIITPLGWLLDGWLWYFDHSIDLTPVRARLAAKWDLSDHGKLCAPTFSSRPFLVDMLTHLLCFLSETGYTRMVKLFWDLMRLQPTERQLRDIPETGPYSAASFEQIIDVESRKVIWPSPIPSHRPKILRADKDPFQSLCEPPGPLRRDVQWIFDAILLNKSLAVGRLESSEPSLEAYQAMFEEASVGKRYFAPAEYCEERITRRHFNRWQPRAFQISPSNRQSPDGHQVLAYRGLDTGEWLVDDTRLTRICLD
ncbi:MAG: hypothetical protein M1820_008036 [Bogoriella megaspora]|nr:MAG: hypothetical protein M1820_008036 [Bogoriella megaspora]